MDFAAFKSGGPAQSVFRRMNLSELLEAASSWRELRTLVVAHNDRHEGRFVDARANMTGCAVLAKRSCFTPSCMLLILRGSPMSLMKASPGDG